MVRVVDVEAKGGLDGRDEREGVGDVALEHLVHRLGAREVHVLIALEEGGGERSNLTELRVVQVRRDERVRVHGGVPGGAGRGAARERDRATAADGRGTMWRPGGGRPAPPRRCATAARPRARVPTRVKTHRAPHRTERRAEAVCGGCCAH